MESVESRRACVRGGCSSAMQRCAGLRGHPLAGMTNAGSATSFALRTLHSLRSFRLSLCLGIAPLRRIRRGFGIMFTNKESLKGV